MDNDWAWNDELVREFAEYYRKKQGVDYSTWGKCILDSFKKSKQQSKNNQDWEILSVATSIVENNELPFQNFMLKYPGKFPIKKVKVLSSGEIFSLGDKVIRNNYLDTIYKFEIRDDRMYVIFCNEETCAAFDISELSKPKQPFFTTEQQSEIKLIIEEYLKCK